jgi:ATP-binding cassette subfamily C (CFTR/MRP) protein 1
VTLSLIWVTRSFSEFEANLTSIERIQEYCDLPPEVKEIRFTFIFLLARTKFFKKMEKFFKAEWEIKENKPEKEWPREGSIKFENYFLKYREELDFVLNGINCDIKSGEKVF